MFVSQSGLEQDWWRFAHQCLPRLQAEGSALVRSRRGGARRSVRGATPRFDHALYLEGLQTPVFFGAAIHNFGVKELLDSFVQLAPPLICVQSHFDEMEQILRSVLTVAWSRL